MTDSNGAFAELAGYDDELAEIFDKYERLPEPGSNQALDAFCDRKNISINALVRLGTRLAEYDVLAFPFPGGIKYRDIITDRKWSYGGSEFRNLKIVPAAREPTDCVIVAEGETDGARLTMLYPEVDVAILPAGADPRPHASRYADQLRGYQLILQAQDPDRGGDTGSAMLAELLSNRNVRFTTPTGKDWCEFEGEPPPLPTPPEVVCAGGLVFEDLRGILSDALPAPDLMVDELLYVEGVHWISGHPGCGKTTLMMHAAWTVMQAGRHVVWLDYEGGLRPTLRRLRDVGIPDETLLEFFHYAGWPKDAPTYFSDVAAKWPGAFIIMDSASKSITLSGLDENSPGDITSWVAPIVYAAKTHSLPVAVIDHVTKNASATSRYARGAGSKLADSDVAWFVDAVEQFNREHSGLVRCSIQKDRDGALPLECWYEIGDGAGQLTVLPTSAPIQEEPTEGSENVSI